MIRTCKPKEIVKIEKYQFIDDRKRCFLSILLQRAAIQHRFGIKDDEYKIERTSEVNFSFLLFIYIQSTCFQYSVLLFFKMHNL
jgi:hypothetical protein